MEAGTQTIPEVLFRQIEKLLPLAVTAIIVVNQRKEILLIKRAIEPLMGYWNLPGGRIERGERPKDTAIRELREETGIVATSIKELGVTTLNIPERSAIEINFLVDVNSPKVSLNNEASEYGWFQLTNLPNKIVPTLIEAIKLINNTQKMEWSNKSKYNSFNSYKGLTYYENYRQIVKWLDGKGELPPPIEVNLDPMAECNLRCYFCITQRYLRTNRAEVGEMRQLPFKYILDLVDFLTKWGVRGLCMSGGGEPTIHNNIADIISYAARFMDVALVTNATIMSKVLVESCMFCRWIALSVDASDQQTYEKVKGKNLFSDVVVNIARLAKERRESASKVDLCFKFLILPENQHQIYDACKLAKELGVQDFHARPVDFERKDIEGARKLNMDIDSIYEQFEKCHEIEDENFHAYTITHKFDSDFHVKYDYASCLAAPLIFPVLTDGNAYICVEHKMEKKHRLGSAYPNPEKILEWWGSDKHRQMIKDIVPDRDCSRCIYGPYHSQIEAIKTDSMCLAFP